MFKGQSGAQSLLLPVILLATATAFWPALNGPFLLDDFLHLPKLGENGAVDDLRAFYQLVFTGTSATGRPLAFLTLLLNDNSWPSNPWTFKYTNLMFHLLNGVLVFIFSRKLLQLVGSRNNSRAQPLAVPLAVTAIWLLHPIQLSPTMLVIQRMTLLMATFTLLGLITYLKGREIAAASPTKGYVVMSLGVSTFGVLGVLSKEPAVMMVCYILAAEATVLAPIARPRGWKLWAFCFLYLPLFAVAWYFFHDSDRMQELYIKREFTMPERLLTELRVLVDYARVIILPSLSQSGPYHDDYLISRGLLDPPSTLLAGLLVASATIFAVTARKRHPFAAMAIAWFLMGHLLESTVLPLELYFEHRNYLPMLGIVFAGCYWAFSTTTALRRIAPAGLALYLILESAVTVTAAKTWGDETLIANVWAHEHPGSPRAQLDAIKFWLTEGQVERARHHHTIAVKHNPDDSGLQLYGFLVDRCNKDSDLDFGVSLQRLTEIIPHGRFDHASLDSIRFLIEKSSTGRCEISDSEILEIVDLYLRNPKFRSVAQARGFLYQAQSRVHIRAGNLTATIDAMDKAYEAVPNYGFPLNQAYLLYTAGLYDDALRYIERARNTPPSSPYVRLWQETKREKALHTGRKPPRFHRQ
jgi:hypothetical protein